jgi:hypothetical protein
MVLALCLAFSSLPAHAQTVVNFYLNPGGVTFTTTGTDKVSATFTAGNNSATWGTSAGKYTLVGGPVALTETSPTSNIYTASSTPLTLTLNSISGPAGTLTGHVTLVSFTQTHQSGTFNDTLVANVTVTSATGSLASNSGNLILSLNLGSPNAIDNLCGPTKITNGAGTLYLTPEPESLLLFGSGLLALGGSLRRRIRTV